ncbi:MAG: 2-oxoacid:acceptor oxidoreductase subunit alpha [bacterium]|nr:2-oxoacid:acceptor oxidoreductase subunit alpha [bacterium]
MKLLPRYTIKAAGESGQGVNSVGEMIAKSLKESGYYTFGYREYPSLIKGGYSCHQIELSDAPMNAPSAECDFLLCLSRYSVKAYLPTVRHQGIVIHSLRQLQFTPEEVNFIADRGITVAYIPAETVAIQAGGKSVMANMVMVGVLWQLLSLPDSAVQQVIAREFAPKPQFIEPNKACFLAGYTLKVEELKPVKVRFVPNPSRDKDAVMTGNQALAFGAVAAGVRAYYSYPMTPTSSLLSTFVGLSDETKMLVRQVEDEISVAQMAIGSMFMGTRALVATSGGGFDLMTESLSLAAMTETPFVCILGQRPGPATGLPTWTAAADLNLAIYSGHGEFARCVIAVSDPSTAYVLIQRAFNLAEKYQIPVIVLTEKQIAESLFQVDVVPANVPIERHLVGNDDLASLRADDRYAVTETGVSQRWLPGQEAATFDGNGDEHLSDGSLTEAAEPVQAIYDKRLKKLDTLVAELPPPQLYGPVTAALTFLGWGSVKNTVLDVLEAWNKAHPAFSISYIHVEYLYPLKVEALLPLLQQASSIIPIENNAFAQLANLITQETGFTFKETFLKYDGRPFFVEDVVIFLEEHLSHV